MQRMTSPARAAARLRRVASQEEKPTLASTAASTRPATGRTSWRDREVTVPGICESAMGR